MRINLEKINCDFCGSRESDFFGEQIDLIHKVDSKLYKVVTCRKCGLKYTNPRPSIESISEYYSNKYKFHSSRPFYYELAKKLLEKLANSRLIRISSFILPKKINHLLIKYLKPKIKDPVLEHININYKDRNNMKFLDIGCGSGITTNFWGTKSSLSTLSKTINAYGLEPSLNSRKILSTHKVNSYADISCVKSNEKFNIIRLNWSLEHVHSPRIYFEFIEKQLYDNGIAVICVPNINGILYRLNPNALELPVHLYHFDIFSLKNYAEKYNLAVDRFLTFSYPEMYLFAEKIGLIDNKYKFNHMSLSNAFNFLRTHTIFDDTGLGNELCVVLKKI